MQEKITSIFAHCRIPISSFDKFPSISLLMRIHLSWMNAMFCPCRNHAHTIVYEQWIYCTTLEFQIPCFFCQNKQVHFFGQKNAKMAELLYFLFSTLYFDKILFVVIRIIHFIEFSERTGSTKTDTLSVKKKSAESD